LRISHSRPWITKQDQLAVQQTLDSGMIACGAKVSEFEQAVANYSSLRFTVSQPSGTVALILALKTLSIGEGDEVILPTYVCKSVLFAVIAIGALPVLCDVDVSGVITAFTVQPCITQKTKAIIAVHIFGRPCDIDELRIFSVPIIEDACQAFGLNVNQKIAGGLGDLGIYSFHGTKCLTTGEGGMLVTNNEELGVKARILSMGFEGRLGSSSHFFPASFSDIQASLGLSQLKRYSDFIQRRQAICKKYEEALKTYQIFDDNFNKSNVPFRFTVSVNEPFESLKPSFSRHQIDIRKGVDELLHRNLNLDDKDFPVATEIFEKTISIPLYPSLTQEEISKVIESFTLIPQ
jgi:perosamine synthetase